MHIAYLVQQFPPEVGAGPARVSELATRWIGAGAEVTVVTGMPNRPEGRIRPEYRGRLFVEEEWEGIRVLRSWLYASPKRCFIRTVGNNLSFLASGAVHAIFRLRSVDVLIASSPPFFPHIAGSMTAGFRRMPLVLEIRDLWPDYLVDMGVLSSGGVGAGALHAIERFLIRNADHTVVVTESFRRRVIAKGAPEDTVAVIPNGVDLGQYYASNEAAPLPAMDRSQDEFVVGYLGNIGAGQDIPSVVRAAARIIQRDPAIRFIIAGDGPERRPVEALVSELGMDNLTIHGPIPKSHTRAFYNACDICLVPLADVPVFQETVPSKLFEIMACERPVMASVAGEAAHIVEESGGGITVAPGDPEGIAKGIESLLRRSPEERREMGQRGRRYVGAHYDRLVLADRYLELLSEVAGRNSSLEPQHSSGGF